MNCLIASVFLNTGLAKTTGKPFTLSRALVLVPFVGSETANFQSRGHGFAVVDLAVSDQFFSVLQAAFVRDFKGLPVEYDVLTSLDRDGRNVITGFTTTI